jgi:hypothetical protein
MSVLAPHLYTNNLTMLVLHILTNNLTVSVLGKGQHITKNRKNGFIVFPSHKIMVKNIQSSWKLCSPWWVPVRRCETQLAHLMYHVDVGILPPPQFYLSDMWRELSILSYEEQFLSTQCRCHSVLWHTGSHYVIIIFIINFISLLLTLRKSKLNLFGSHYVSFLTRSLGFLELFSNSPLSTFSRLSWGTAFRLALTRTI